MNIRSIEGAFEKLKAAASSSTNLEIDLTGVTDTDITFLQLIESARRTAADAGTAIRLSAPVRDQLLETARRSGFFANPADARTQFWLAQ